MASWGLIAGCHARCGHGTAAFPCSRNPAEPQPFPLLLTFSISTFFLKVNCGQFPRFYYCRNVKLFSVCNVFRGAPLDVNNEHHHSRFFLAITPFSIPLESAMHIWDGSFQMNLAF